MPARLIDNPFVNREQYMETLAHLPRAERERLLHGDWDVPDDGELFQREWFTIIERRELPEKTHAVRFWDLAATEPGPANPDPDYTVGLRLELDPKSGVYYLTDLVRVRKSPGAIERLVVDVARRDGQTVAIRIEQEPGASGTALADRYTRDLLRGYRVKPIRATGTKETRATVVAAAAENGLVRIVAGPHTDAFLDELTAFPHGAHDDCVDALAGAHQALTKPHRWTVHVPRGRMSDYAPQSRLVSGYGIYLDRIDPDKERAGHIVC